MRLLQDITGLLRKFQMDENGSRNDRDLLSIIENLFFHDFERRNSRLITRLKSDNESAEHFACSYYIVACSSLSDSVIKEINI